MAQPRVRRAELRSPVRFGVVGTGWWATEAHLPALRDHSGADLRAVCDQDSGRAHAAAAAYGADHVFEDLPEMLAAGLLDAMVVATPHTTHHVIAAAALRCGLHVLVEKPLATTAAEAWELVTLARERGLHLGVGYTYQHTSTALVVREAVRSGVIGEVTQVVAEFSSGTGRLFAAAEGEAPPTTGPVDPTTYSLAHGGGQAHTQLTHVVGSMLWALDREGEEVTAYMDHRGLAVDVADVLAFRLEGGTLGVAASTGLLAPGSPLRHRLVFLGSEGSIEQNLLTASAEIHTASGTRRHTVLPSEPAYPIGEPVRAFTELIAGRGPEVTPGSAGAATVAFLEAAHTSARTGRPQKVAAGP